MTAFKSPWQNAYAERVIGTIRRQCLDHVIVCSQRHLSRLLTAYVDYHNNARLHLSLDGDAPNHRPPASGKGRIVAFPQVGGLHHRYDRCA